MAVQDLTRKNTFMHKREIRYFAEEIDVVDLISTSGDNYQLSNIPDKALILSAVIFIKEVVNGVATVDVGTSPTGSDIFNDADVSITTPVVSSLTITDTDAGLPLYITPTWGSAVTQGKLLLVVEYLEYRLKSDEFTEIPNV